MIKSDDTKIDCIAFVDWDTTRRLGNLKHDPLREAEKVFSILQQKISDGIESIIDKKNFLSVKLRLYHGWYSGKTKTDDFKIVDKFRRNFVSRSFKKVRFEPEYEIATSLICGGERNYLYDSHRTINGESRQKIVDTSIVSDLLCFGKRKVETHKCCVIVVISDDDDILPGVITAERWKCFTYVLRLFTKPSSSLNTHGIIIGEFK